MEFVIQSKDGVSADTVEIYELVWLLKQLHVYGHTYVLSSDATKAAYKNHIPVGSIEFVNSHLRTFYNTTMKPIEVPEQLRTDEFLKRKYMLVGMEDLPQTGYWFIKDATTYKSMSCKAALSPDYIKILFESSKIDKFAVSSVINIDAEYRCFIHKGKLVAVQRYDGRPDVFPDADVIHKMLTAYTDAPPAYTLDVAVTNSSTVVLEVHPFACVGTYGFVDEAIIWMYKNAYEYLTKQ